MKATQTTVLGKRKATTNDENFVLLLSPSPSTSALPSTSTLPFPERLDSDSSSKQASDTISDFIIINGKLVPHTKKCYRCTHLGCDKAYTKPSRLEEHERTHTGQTPHALWHARGPAARKDSGRLNIYKFIILGMMAPNRTRWETCLELVVRYVVEAFKPVYRGELL
ncbi:hypothetical protein JR316_0002053 [Psilocybe cubensis]|uniref:Uncharacterized protein n=1 Tax=Psilocybe cubensis TaxID=181762 RepID=A0ACB8HBB8_PSICU|nr:hypothetical protein JR316_0002053 [Psilocybe cubensis]KAH9485146.1 hypothetical protein JR316_0002053 [Psilocybe cubensis]